MAINLEEYYKKYGPLVFRRCRFLLKDEHKAMDAMQDIFARLLLKQDTIKDEYPSTYLYRMATNECLNIIRNERNRNTSADTDLLGEIADMTDFEETFTVNDILNRLFGREKAGTKMIAVMHYIDEMTYEQIAAALKMSVSGIRKRLAKLKLSARNMKKNKEF